MPNIISGGSFVPNLLTLGPLVPSRSELLLVAQRPYSGLNCTPHSSCLESLEIQDEKTPACVWAAGAQLGEGPVWSTGEQRLYWVDILGRAIHGCSADGGQRATITVPDVIGCIALRRGGGLVAGLGRSLAFVDLPDGKTKPFAAPEEDMLGNRFNDGKCDRRGRFWAGTMDLRTTRPTGTLYRLDANLRVAPVLSGFAITNGVGWSPDDRTLYVTDSNNREILAFDFDAHSGEVSGRRAFARVPTAEGFPDGLTVSADGDVWSAHWDGWRVTRYSADGTIREVIQMPVPRPTSCMFGGADLSTLFVTSATDGLTDEELDNAPLSGGLFAVPTGTIGLPEPSFAG